MYYRGAAAAILAFDITYEVSHHPSLFKASFPNKIILLITYSSRCFLLKISRNFKILSVNYGVLV